MSSLKPRRVFQLRKTSTVRPQTQKQPVNEDVPFDQVNNNIVNNKSNVSNFSNRKDQINNNSSLMRVSNREGNKSQIVQQQTQKKTVWVPLVDGPELEINVHELFFKQKVNIIQVKDLKIKNIGSSSVYYELCFKNPPKISPSAIKDPKPKFHSHYEPSVILPGQQLTFSFSFISESPGIFIEECEILCRPQTRTKIIPIKLKGQSYIDDEFQSKRESFKQKFQDKIRQKFVKQVLEDIINAVKSPQPPLPDVQDPVVAEELFEQKNWGKGLYYDPKVHTWFDNLFRQAWSTVNGQDASDVYWNQSVDQLKSLIQKVKDECLQESYRLRLQNYCYLSLTPSKSSTKSDLFQSIKQFILDTGFRVGGNITDEVKKQMQMWQIPFQEPKEESTEEQIKAQLDQKVKIKAEWAKKMKKKKWGEEQEKQIVKQYHNKVSQKIKMNLASKFEGFSSKANLIKIQKKLYKPVDIEKHFGFLERLKTVKQYKVQGKKILLKFNLKLKDNSKQKLNELQEYLTKKKQEQIRFEQEKRNQQLNAKKKKQSVAKKKKGQKEEEQIKPLIFDFDSLLDQEAWNGIMNTIKLVMERQPFLLVIGCSYGPRKGVFDEKYSIKFLLQHMKKSESSIEFLSHNQLFQFPQKLQQEQINQGSVYLTQNLNFLPCEVMQQQKITEIQPATQQVPAVVSRQTEKLLMSQIRQSLMKTQGCFQVIITEDRANNISGLTTFNSCETILGTYSWKYVAISLQIKRANIVIGGDFEPNKLLLLGRLLQIANKVYLTGSLGIKFYLAQENNKNKIHNISITDAEKQGILNFLSFIKNKGQLQKLILPQDFLISYSQQKNIQGQEHQKAALKLCPYQPQNQYPEGSKICDIGEKTVETILLATQAKQGQNHFYIVNRPQIVYPQEGCDTSLTTISRHLYNTQQVKKQSHQKQATGKSGIDYQNDLVVYLVGIDEKIIEKIELVPKKPKKNQNQEEAEQQQEEQPEEDDLENQKKKIDLIADYKLYNSEIFENILLCQFDPGFKDVSRYPKSD